MNLVQTVTVSIFGTDAIVATAANQINMVVVKLKNNVEYILLLQTSQSYVYKLKTQKCLSKAKGKHICVYESMVVTTHYYTIKQDTGCPCKLYVNKM